MKMTNEQIVKRCKEKEQELLNKYFGDLVLEAAVDQPETIGTYTKDLPLKVEAEFREFLEELWKEVAPEGLKGTPLVLEEEKLRELMTNDDREGIEEAYKDATERTLWNASPRQTTRTSPTTKVSSMSTPATSS